MRLCAKGAQPHQQKQYTISFMPTMVGWLAQMPKSFKKALIA
jgi:hypothetical protein